MKKIIFSIVTLMTSSFVWADIIRPPHKGLYQHDQGVIIPLACLLAFLTINFGIAFYLKRKTK